MRRPRRLFIVLSFALAFAAAYEARDLRAQAVSTQPQTQNQAAQRLTLQEAENIAIQNHPQIQAAAQLASAALAQVKEVQAAYFPQASGSLTGAKAETDSRIAAGFLNSPSVFDKFADGVSVSQLLRILDAPMSCPKVRTFTRRLSRKTWSPRAPMCCCASTLPISAF